MRFLRWLFGSAEEVPRAAMAARREAIRQAMDEHPAHRGECTGRREPRRIGDRLHYWRAAWRDRESGG